MACAPENELAEFSDHYFQANIIDGPKDYFANLPPEEKEEILSFYRSGKFLKVMREGQVVGYWGYGLRPVSSSIVIFYLILPEFRGKGLFSPMVDAFGKWCLDHYPDMKYLVANTEKTNASSIKSLQRAGFELLEIRMDGPEQKKVQFMSYRKAFR